VASDSPGILAHELGFRLGLTRLNAPEPVLMLLFWHWKEFGAGAVGVFTLPVDKRLLARLALAPVVGNLEFVGWLAAGEAVYFGAAS